MIKVKNYVIDYDGLCYTVGEEKTSEKGKEYIANKTYHGTLKLALNHIMKQLQGEYVRTHETTLESALKEFKSIKEEIEQLALEIDTSEVIENVG